MRGYDQETQSRFLGNDVHGPGYSKYCQAPWRLVFNGFIRDNGPGVSDTKKIFDPFVTTKAKGMGICLAVSRTIVETYDGRLWAENSKAGGAIFNMALPLSHAGPTAG